MARGPVSLVVDLVVAARRKLRRRREALLVEEHQGVYEGGYYDALADVEDGLVPGYQPHDQVRQHLAKLRGEDAPPPAL